MSGRHCFTQKPKTMLKNKITAKGLLSHGLLLMIPFNIGFVKKEPLHASHFQNAMIAQSRLKASTVDTNFVDVDSSVIVNSLPEIVSAPKFYLNASAKKYVKHFVVKNEEDLQRIKAKSPSYFRTIEFIFRKHEVPLELKYLAVIESELNTTARSRTGAIGLWQMMAETARDFGLKVNKKTDERKHFYKSTEAAAKYLKSLYGEFNDWLLVVAAYNS